MPQGITDYQAFLQEAKQAVLFLRREEEAFDRFRKEEKRLERALQSEQKAVEDSVRMTVKKRQDEINASYDKQIAKGQERLRKVRAKRESAKDKGMQERIAEETQELHDHNRELRTRLRTLFQKSGLPAFCRSDLYFSLYFPRTPREIACLLGAVLLCFLLVPCGIYLLIPNHRIWMLVLIYFADILLFGGLYMTVNNRTKAGYGEVFREGRQIRDVIRDNKKKIRVITNSIRKDSSEAHYDLQQYDDEIAKLEQELSEIAKAKNEALNTFERVTKAILTDEIVNSSKGRMDQLDDEYRKAEAGRKEKEQSIQAKNLEITDKYEGYLGRGFLEPQKLDELIGILRDGSASNLNEAIDLYQRRAQQPRS